MLLSRFGGYKQVKKSLIKNVYVFVLKLIVEKHTFIDFLYPLYLMFLLAFIIFEASKNWIAELR